MLSNRLAFAALAVACIGAAAGGGYLATRQNTVPTSASAQIQTVSTPATATSAATTASVPPASTSAVAPAKPVQETEGVIGDAPRMSAASPKASAAKQAEPPAR